MAEKGISYLNRNYNDYRNSLLTITQQYYSEILPFLNDASIGSWFIDLFADIADNLSYHIDKTYQETMLESAKERASLINMARNMGVKIPGPRAAIVEVEVSCELPINTQGRAYGSSNLSEADENYAPYIKQGTLISDGLNTFELMEDCDFREQFNEDGYSDRIMIPNRDSNGNIISYKYSKVVIATAGTTKIAKRYISNNDIKPFMEITLQDENIMGIDSIIMVDGSNITNDPYVNDFKVDEEEYVSRSGFKITRFFEVDNLIEPFRFGQSIEKNTNNTYNPIWNDITTQYVLDENDEVCTLEQPIKIRSIAKGEWKRLKHKFVTEYNENGGIKIIFGSGIENKYGEIPDNATEFTKYMMSRMEANDYLGVLPKPNHTLYIMYRVGGGVQTNIAPNTLRSIIKLNVDIDGNCEDNLDARKKRAVLDSIKVTNTTSSYGGKDTPSNEEIKYLIKYYRAAQNRCVTLKDYEYQIMQIPHKYGSPFRCAAIEENNKIMIYTLGLDHNGKLTNVLSEFVADNIKEYLSNYKMLNDLIEIHSGSVINIGFEIDIFVDKSYDKSEVVKRVINTTRDYIDIRKHFMGEDIFVGDLEKEISKLDGVSNLIEIRCYDKAGEPGYSNTPITQPYVTQNECDNEYTDNSLIQSNVNRIDLKNSDKILISEAYSMFEVKYNKDIKVNVKIR